MCSVRLANLSGGHYTQSFTSIHRCDGFNMDINKFSGARFVQWTRDSTLSYDSEGVKLLVDSISSMNGFSSDFSRSFHGDNLV